MHGLALRPVAVPSPLPRLRLVAAVLILAAAFAGAVVLHGHRVRQPVTPCIGTLPCAQLQRPGWADPIALGICLLGVTRAAGVLLLVRPARGSNSE